MTFFHWLMQIRYRSLNLFIQKESLSIMIRYHEIDDWIDDSDMSIAMMSHKLFDAVFQNDPCQFTSESFLSDRMIDGQSVNNYVLLCFRTYARVPFSYISIQYRSRIRLISSSLIHFSRSELNQYTSPIVSKIYRNLNKMIRTRINKMIKADSQNNRVIY